MNLDFKEIKQIIEHARAGQLTEEDLDYLEKLGNLINYLDYLSQNKSK